MNTFFNLFGLGTGTKVPALLLYAKRCFMIVYIQKYIFKCTHNFTFINELTEEYKTRKVPKAVVSQLL